ncbi:TolC family protein [Azohydromonas sp.]|uniref:TolC family protein n=1 Tax=Azohydromonas sp. TaxID=1872666 RepID=UPI002CA16DD8|nr:TolC family protein [Azohydromonas sp.]HMM85713.1 TolC family protein [Azohydromonas sp.]
MSRFIVRVPQRHAGRRPPPTRTRALTTRLALGAVALCSSLAWADPAGPALGYVEALELARQVAPALRAQQATLAGSTALVPAASALPDPRLSVGVENLPIAGPDRWSTTRDGGTMQRIALMQEMPNRAKRDAREQAAQARIERDRATLTATELAVRRDAGLAWLAVHFAEARLARVAGLERENRLLQDTLPARIAAGSAMPAELTMARQEALAIADRTDELARDVRKARAELRRWVGERADAPLQGDAPPIAVDGERLRAALPHHAELAPFAPMRAMAQAEMAEADAEQRGDWSWELAYSRRPRYDDMVSFQLSFDLPWQRDRRQQPQIDAKRREIERIEAEREELLRRHAAETDAMLAELQALDAQAARLRSAGLPLAAERVTLAMAAYQAGRGDLSAVLAARSQALEIELRAVDLDAQRAALRLRLSTLIAE